MGSGQFIIRYDAMDQLYSMVSSKTDSWAKELDGWYKSYQSVVSMDTFTGSGAAGAKSYLSEVHGLLLGSLYQAISEYQSSLLLYKNGYYNIDDNIYSVLPQKGIQSLSRKMSSEEKKLEEIYEVTAASLNGVRDIFSIINPDIIILQNSLREIKKDADNLITDIQSYEDAQSGTASGSLLELMNACTNAINSYLDDGSAPATYVPGALAGNFSMLELYRNVKASDERVKEKQALITEAAERQAVVYAQMQADYDAAVAARKDKGTAEMIMAGAAIVVGIAAIVCTAGAATPIVAAACIAGTASAAYGVSNMYEGYKDVDLANRGDISTSAFNPLRDTIFAGNQSLYDAWGEINMTVAGLCIPLKGAVNLVAGSSTDVIAKTAIKCVSKELIKTVAIEGASQGITHAAADQFGLNLTESAILKLGLTVGMDKGSEAIGEKLGLVDKPTYIEKGSYKDAKEYNITHDLDNQTANSFRNSSYSKTVLDKDTVMYRVYGGDSKKVGSYLSETPQNGGLQSQLDLALKPEWGNSAENVSTVVVPKGTTVYSGYAAPQSITDSSGNVIGTLPGGGSQIYIPKVNPAWFK